MIYCKVTNMQVKDFDAFENLKPESGTRGVREVAFKSLQRFSRFPHITGLDLIEQHVFELKALAGIRMKFP